MGIGPGSSGPICPGSRHEPGPMGRTPGPHSLVPVHALNRYRRGGGFSPCLCHEPGQITCLYIPTAVSEHSRVLCFVKSARGGHLGARSLIRPFCIMFLYQYLLHYGLLFHVMSQYLWLFSLIYKVYMKRKNAGSWNSGLKREQILETYSTPLQKS